jgi:hypothetical protein
MIIHQAFQEQVTRRRAALRVPAGAVHVEVAGEDGVGADNTRPVCLMGWSYHVALPEGIVNVNQRYLPSASLMHIQYLDVSPHLSLEVRPRSYFPLGIFPDTSHHSAPFDPDEVETWVLPPMKTWRLLDED